MTRRLGVVLFPRFEVLDVFGPLECFGFLQEQIEVVTVAAQPGPIESGQRTRVVADRGFADCPRLDLLMIPGGLGTRTEVDNPLLIDWIGQRAREAEIVMSVCTGAALLARTGILDGRRATTNKRSFEWVTTQGPRVRWVPVARWVEDGNLISSSGISAGMDMTLAVIARLFGQDVAESLATRIEYDWHRDAHWDPFAKVYGLG